MEGGPECEKKILLFHLSLNNSDCDDPFHFRKSLENVLKNRSEVHTHQRYGIIGSFTAVKLKS